MSGWIMAFMVMVVLVGLGFMSLMDLSSQQTKTERELFQLQQEFNKSRADAELGVYSASRDDVYSQLNSDTEVVDGTMVDPNAVGAMRSTDDLAAPFPIGAERAIEKLEGSSTPVATAVPEVKPTPVPGATPVPGVTQ
jgi:hypothetical protein